MKSRAQPAGPTRQPSALAGQAPRLSPKRQLQAVEASTSHLVARSSRLFSDTYKARFQGGRFLSLRKLRASIADIVCGNFVRPRTAAISAL